MVGVNTSVINNNMNQLSKTNPELAGILGLSIIVIFIIFGIAMIYMWFKDK